jgi:hypothetical protein
MRDGLAGVGDVIFYFFCREQNPKLRTKNSAPPKTEKKTKPRMASLPDGLAAKAAAFGIDVSWIAKPVTHTLEQAWSVHARNEAAYGTDGMRWCQYHTGTRLVFGVRLLQAHQRSGRTCLEVSRIWETLARPAPRLSRSLQNLKTLQITQALQMWLILPTMLPSSAEFKEICESPTLWIWHLTFWQSEFRPKVKFP